MLTVPVSGEGLYVFDPFITPAALTVIITAIGEAAPIDLSSPARYMHIGWFAMADHRDGSGDEPEAYYLHEPHFLWYVESFFQRVIQPDASTGIDGFRYVLGVGVEATFFWYN